MTDSKTPSEASTDLPMSPPAVDVPTADPPKKPRKGGCGCMLPLLLLLALIGFAPQIIMMTSLRNQIPAMLMAELPPGVVIGSASVGWTSALQLNDIVIPDDQGRPSLTLKHVTLSRSLWELTQSKDDLGKIAIEKPVLNLYLDNGVTNYDKFLARLAAKKGSGKRSLIDLKLMEGQIAIRKESRAKAAAKPAVDLIPLIDDVVQPLSPESGPAAPPALNEPVIVDAVEAPAGPDLPKKVIALIDLKSATFKSQLASEDELVGELTAVLREPAVEQPVTGELRWNLPDGAETGIGSGQLKLDVPSLPLGVLSPWLASFTSGRDLSGEISLHANAEVVPSEKGLLLAAQIKVPHLDLRLSPVDAQSQPFRWVGDDLLLIAEGQGDLAGQLLTIESVQLRTPIVNADLAGTVRDLPGQAICGLVGKCDLNLADLLAGLPPKWAEKIQVDGLQLGEIRVEGALRRGSETAKAPVAVVEWKAAPVAAMGMPLRINADVQWASANVMGFKSENALVSVDWSERQLSINPNRLPIGSGQWVASPRIDFTPTGNYLVFDGGPVLENVDFTQEMSETWLRYVSPLLGSATSIEGSFSLSASPLRVALAPPHDGDFKGVIAIHSAKVGPGPLVKQILTSISALQTMLGRNAGANNTWMQVDEQQVPFAFVDGRIYHKDLTVGLGDVVVQSEGSVGLDETIDFRISVPIPDKWTTGKPLFANLKGEVIPLDMQGTLDQPQLDGQALANFGKQIGFKSAGGLLQQLLEKRLEKKENGEVPATPRPRRQR